MAPIANLTRVTVIGTFVDLDGDPISGRITFSPNFDALCDPDESVIVDNVPMSTDLDSEGSFSLTLPATDDPDATPQNWNYTVTEPTGRVYNIPVPRDTPGGVLDLVDAVPSGLATGGVALLARRIRDSQDYTEPGGPPQDGQVLTWDATTSTYQPQAPAVYTAENARDDVGAALTEGSTAIDITLDDAANTITITPVTGSTAGTLAAGNDSRITGAAQKVNNLGDLLDASTARTNLGLGNAATRGVGATAFDVAAGDDSRIVGAAQKAANLSDLASAATARTNLGLNTAATLAVGTTAGTVAAGDDSRIVGAAQKAANLSDLADASAARTNLGLGNVATRAVGTTAGTAAAGDDSRITGAAQKASNLSDLASVSTARTNLGLGGAALLNVGTTAGTVAAGDDARLLPAYDFGPADHGYLGWTVDPGQVSGSTILAAAGVLYGVKLKMPVAGTIGKIACRVTSAGVTLANTFLAVLDSTGARVALTADLSTVLNASGYFEPSVVTPYAGAAGIYYVVVLCGSAGTLPTFARVANSNVLNDGLVAASGFRAWSSGTGQTAVPSSVALSGTATINQNFWFALKA